MRANYVLFKSRTKYYTSFHFVRAFLDFFHQLAEWKRTLCFKKLLPPPFMDNRLSSILLDKAQSQNIVWKLFLMCLHNFYSFIKAWLYLKLNMEIWSFISLYLRFYVIFDRQAISNFYFLQMVREVWSRTNFYDWNLMNIFPDARITRTKKIFFFT